MNKRKYQYIQVGIASPEEIISWANPKLRKYLSEGCTLKYNPDDKDHIMIFEKDDVNQLKPRIEAIKGEVKNDETINYRTFKPEKDGLFCEVIFGPTKDYQCACQKSHKGITTENGETAVCEKCGVELTESKVRRERMGFIALAAPVVHNWYLRSIPSKIAILLNRKTTDIDNIVYRTSYIITDVDESIDPDFTAYVKGNLITEQEYSRIRRAHPFKFKVMTGAEAIRYELQNLDLNETIAEIHNDLKKATKQKREQLIKRLEICESFAKSPNKPEWMVMDVIPVIPPDLRPMVNLDGGRFATTDLNDLYRRIIRRNIRLRQQYSNHMIDQIIKQEKRILQEACDALIDNSGLNRRNKRPVTEKNRTLKSLSDLLRGKQGRFRQNLLGKRVDYSGRSVIVVGPDLKMYQCGIPREMALILFKPFIINYIRNKYAAVDGDTKLSDKSSIKRAKELIERGAPEAMEALEKLVVEHPVLLNRAPTLHRLSIQAFEPKLVEGKAIRLHPLVCTAFNADFDGDQMPVHLPLSKEAQAEARMLMLASKNILAPKDGKPIVTPSQDMIIGNYYLTIEKNGNVELNSIEEVLAYDFVNDSPILAVNGDEKTLYGNVFDFEQNVKAGKVDKKAKFVILNDGKIYGNPNEVEHAYEQKEIDFHTRIALPAKTLKKNFIHIEDGLKESNPEKYEAEVAKENELENSYIITTYGKLIFNTILPTKFAYVNEAKVENLKYGIDEKFFTKHAKDTRLKAYELAINEPVKKKFLSAIIAEVFRQAKLAETSNTLDKMKDIGFYYSTMSGITVSAFDVVNIEKKDAIIHAAEAKVDQYVKLYRRGLLTTSERRQNVIAIWNKATKDIETEIKAVMKKYATENDIFLMADSGARGSSSNFTQLAGMRGLMAKPNGESMEIPVKSCFSVGLSMSEFFISTHGARKGSTDTALKTAESGYLTRRLVDVSHDVTVVEDDCGTDRGIVMRRLVLDGEGQEEIKLRDRIIGRFASKRIVYKNPQTKVKEVICERNERITEEIADRIDACGIQEVEVRSLLTCNCRNGVCVKCYGSDLSTTEVVEKGEVVGIIAAQSIGEPGTQLTMRTFHSGGVAGGEDITRGLPRVQELFEAREPKGKGVIAEFAGTVTEINHIEDENRFEITLKGEHDIKEYKPDSGKQPCVKVGDQVNAGDLLVKGMIHPKELLRITNVKTVEKYIVEEILKVYRSQGVDISDKHIEIITKQMLQKALVLHEGDTELIPGTYISRQELFEVIKDCIKAHKRLPVVKPILLGITRASLKADSFLSAASFQETTRVLTEAAIRGKIDRLEGLKENIIIGGLIPAGTGLVDSVEIEPADPLQDEFDVPKL